MTQAEIKALIDEKITSNGAQEITGEVLNDVLQEIADACGYTFDIDVYPADAALEITFYNPDNPDGVAMKVNAEVSNLGNSKLEAISAWWAAQTERKLNKTAGYDIDLTNVSTSPSTLGVTKVIEAGQIIQSFTGASKLIFGATDATNVTVNSTDLPYTATKTLYNVKLESGTAANLKITVANGIVSVSQNTSIGGYDLSIGSDTYNIANGQDVNQLGQYINDRLGWGSFSPKEIGLSGENADYNALPNIDIKQGEKFRCKFSTNGTYTRVIICYNGSNSNRLWDSQNKPDANNIWMEFTAPTDITQLGYYIVLSGDFQLMAEGNKQFDTDDIKDAAITTSKIANKAVTVDKIDDSAIDSVIDIVGERINDRILVATRSENLFNELNIIVGKFVSNNGDINTGDGWAISPYIPVEGGHYYTISCATSGRDKGIVFLDADKNYLWGGGVNIYTTFLAPEGAAYMVFNVANNNVYSTDIMVVEGQTAKPYAPYNRISTDKIIGFDEKVEEEVEIAIGQVTGSGKLSVVKSGNNITISDGTNSISGALTNNASNEYGGNPVFDLLSWTYNSVMVGNGDDIAPIHAYNITIGANHGQPCIKATIASHGLDNTAIGTAWVQGSHTFYIMRIVDSNNVIFLSENLGTMSSPSFVDISTGSITQDGTTLTITSVTSTQLYPALKNHNIKLVLNGVRIITDDGTYNCNYFDIVEDYEIMNPASTLQKIIARAGESGEPVFDGDAGVRIENTYRFTKSLSVLVIANVVPLQEFTMHDVMFAQAGRIGDNNTIKYYVPNSLPLGANGEYDMRQPLLMNWSSSVSGTTINSSKMAQPQTHPVNRVLQYATNVGFALGFLTDRGVGQSLLDYTSNTFELRNNTGKVYPHGIESSKVGSPMNVGDIYTAVLYRSLFIPEASGNRLSMYHFDLDGVEYVFVDYKGTMLDRVIVDNSLNGKKIEVLESVNTTLKTNVYNDGFYVDATFVTNETCYMIAKIG